MKPRTTALSGHSLSLECCRAPQRGTIAGYFQHLRQRTIPCVPCTKARNTYLAEMIAAWAPGAGNPAQERCRAFVENYLYLIDTGETNAEAIARRLATTPPALERRLYRLGLHVLHPPVDQRATVRHKRLAVAA